MKETDARSFGNISIFRTAAFLMMIAAFSAAAMAQCGASLNAMVTAAAAVQKQPDILLSAMPKPTAVFSDMEDKPTIVGLWDTRFLVGGNEIQRAFQIWNEGGTEVHNPNVDPRTSAVCLGSWERVPHMAYRLTHRVWFWDANGNQQGTGHLSETVVVGNHGNTHSGTFDLKIFDPNGNQVAEVSGDVTAERVHD